MHISEIITKINNREYFRYSTKDSAFQVSSKKDIDSNETVGYEIILRITGKCNFRCLYCGVEDQSLTEKSILRIVTEITKADLKDSSIVISGGEPTISPYFFKLINLLLNAEVPSITIQTNAVMFSNNNFFERLPRDRRIRFFISFLSDKEDIYNEISQSKLYKNAVDGIKNISKYYFFEINMVVNKLNHKDIKSTLDFVKKISFTKNFTFNISNVYINPRLNHDSYLIKYSDLRPSFAELTKSDFLDDIEIVTPFSSDCSFPFCQRPFHESSKDIVKSDNTSDVSYGSLDKKFYKSLECKKCKYDRVCSGFHVEYVKRFGTDEIKPILD